MSTNNNHNHPPEVVVQKIKEKSFLVLYSVIMYIKIFEFRQNTTFDKSLDELALDEMSLDELGMNRSLVKRRRDLNLGVLTN